MAGMGCPAVPPWERQSTLVECSARPNLMDPCPPTGTLVTAGLTIAPPGIREVPATEPPTFVRMTQMGDTLMTETTDVIGPQIGVAATIPTVIITVRQTANGAPALNIGLDLGRQVNEQTYIWLCMDRPVLDCLTDAATTCAIAPVSA